MKKERQELIEKTLNFVANKGWTMHGEKFLSSLCKFLGDILNVDYALIDSYSTENPDIAKTVAVYSKSGFLPNIEYNLIGTPCNNVIGSEMCSYDSNIQELFPDDDLLVQMKVDSYCAIPLWSSKGDPIGLIAIMDSSPLTDVKTYELVLQIVAIKAAHELEKDIYENKLKIQIQELQASEDEMRATNEELVATMDAFEETNNKLNIAKEKAEESDRLKTEFINNMSHEIRTPLNGILGFSSFLNNPDLTDAKKKHYISIIQNSGKQLLNIIDDILEISKLGAKQVEVIEREICLNDMLLELFSIFDIKAKENKTPLYLKKGLKDNESWILTDDIKLLKILNNLLENSMKFTNVGFIEFGYYLENNTLIIYVKDTGIGISESKHKTIFERFSQEEKELSKNVGGLGLGLSIAKENAELLGGTISLDSSKGKGATFFVKIPYNPVSRDSANYNEIINNTEILHYTILIAEDEEINYLFLETLIENEIEAICKVIHAKNGKEAVDICKNNDKIDIVLMDLKMPVMTGFEAALYIKDIRPDLPIIAQTAYSTEKDRSKALLAGCDEFISKPIREKDFKEIFNKYLLRK